MACIRMLGQPRLLDIVDNKWMMDSLPDDDISIPPDHDVPSEDEVDDANDGQKKKKNDSKWSELGLQALGNA